MIYYSRTRRLKLLQPEIVKGRPVGGLVALPGGFQWWSTDGTMESFRKNRSDITPSNEWKAQKDDWEAQK